jgi:hypothetical protein
MHDGMRLHFGKSISQDYTVTVLGFSLSFSSHGRVKEQMALVIEQDIDSSLLKSLYGFFLLKIAFAWSL